jgi:hypothetical protein
MDGGDHLEEFGGVKKEFITAENIVALFMKYDVPVGTSPDLLSVDIDFNDFWVLKTILEAGYRFRVVAVEVNSHVGPREAKVVKYDAEGSWDAESDYSGASVLAMAKLLEAGYGYKLVYCESHGVNCFFVRGDLWGEGLEGESLEAKVERMYRPPNYFGQGCDGGACRRHDEEREWLIVQ